MFKFFKFAVVMAVIVAAGAFIYEKYNHLLCDCDEGKCC